MTLRLDRVDQPWVPLMWSAAKDFIREAMVRGDLGMFADVEDAVFRGRMTLWIATDDMEEIVSSGVTSIAVLGAGVTSIEETERSRSCVIVAWGSDDMHRTLPLLATVEEYAKANDCDCVRLFGRKGWARVLKNYRPVKIVMERRL